MIDRFSGELSLGGPEAERNSPTNSYKLEWVDLKALEKINLIPEYIKEKLINYPSS